MFCSQSAKEKGDAPGSTKRGEAPGSPASSSADIFLFFFSLLPLVFVFKNHFIFFPFFLFFRFLIYKGAKGKTNKTRERKKKRDSKPREKKQ